MIGGVREHAIEPAVTRGLDARRGRFHEILRIEMRARWMRRTDRVQDAELVAREEIVQRLQCRVQTKETIEIDEITANAGRRRHRDRATSRVVILLAKWCDHAETIHGAALEDTDERLLLCSCMRLREQRAREKIGRQPEGEERECAMPDESSAFHRYLL